MIKLYSYVLEGRTFWLVLLDGRIQGVGHWSKKAARAHAYLLGRL